MWEPALFPKYPSAKKNELQFGIFRSCTKKMTPSIYLRFKNCLYKDCTLNLIGNALKQKLNFLATRVQHISYSVFRIYMFHQSYKKGHMNLYIFRALLDKGFSFLKPLWFSF